MSLIKTILKYAAPAPQIGEFQRYLFIGPHPDDIEIGCGATACKLASEQKDICFLICIDGRYGTANMSIGPEEMAEVRKKEAGLSASYLGIDDVRFLDLCDGGFYEYKDLVAGIQKVIGEFKPDIIFCPDPDVTSECHIDHLNVGKAVKTCAYLAPYKNITANYGADSSDVKAIAFYYTAKPNRFVDVRGQLERQIESIFGFHKSQFPEGCDDAKTIPTYIKLKYYFYAGREGFRCLGRTQMHCFPEGGD